MRVVLRFQELCGFAQLVLGISNPQCLEQLLTKRVIRKFVRWLHSEKNCGVGSIGSQVNRIRNVLRWHPTLGNRDFTWMKSLVEEISDAEEELATKCMGPVALHSDLTKVPNKIRSKRRRLKEPDQRLEAWLAQMELLMLLLSTHPWPPLCIRKCRIKGDRPNLFRGQIPRDNYPFTLTVQAEKKLDENSHVRLWQYCFSSAETREQRMARGLVVQRLIPLLERFINQYRHILIGGNPDPETLFVNRSGRAFGSGAFASLVGEICLEYLDVRLTPYQIRRIYTLDWLAKHREDPNRYEQLAIILWVEPSSVIAEYGPEDRIHLPRRNAPRRAFRIRPVRVPQ